MRRSFTPTKLATATVMLWSLTLDTHARAAAPVQLTVADVLGEAVRLGPPAVAPATVLFFVSQRAKDESQEFARAVDERLLEQPIESVAIVDVRRYAGALRRLATSYLRRSAAEARERRRQRRVERGVDASPATVNRWHLLGDFDGALFERFGVEREPAHPVAFVVDRVGGLRGPFRAVGEVAAAVSALLAGDG
jgi:hypothetical protein